MARRRWRRLPPFDLLELPARAGRAVAIAIAALVIADERIAVVVAVLARGRAPAAADRPIRFVDRAAGAAIRPIAIRRVQIGAILVVRRIAGAFALLDVGAVIGQLGRA